jgi:hypothetical protein
VNELVVFIGIVAFYDRKLQQLLETDECILYVFVTGTL